MKRSIDWWQLIGFAVTSLGGTLLHFAYDWLDKAIWIAPFSGVNESTFEHMKLLFWPMLIFATIERLLFQELDSFWCVKLRGILLGMLMIPVIFYTYNGTIGKSPDWINIAIFFVSAAVVYIYETKQFHKNTALCKNQNIAIAVLCLIAILFLLFTFKVPKIELFRDPLTNKFGL